MDDAEVAIPRRFFVVVVASGIILAAIALFVTEKLGDATSVLFDQLLPIPAIGVLLLWAVIAWVARRALYDQPPDLTLHSRGILVWVGSRISLLVATVLLLIPWIIALATGHDAMPTLLRAFILVLVVTALTGIIGGAVLNSALAIRQFRKR